MCVGLCMCVTSGDRSMSIQSQGIKRTVHVCVCACACACLCVCVCVSVLVRVCWEVVTSGDRFVST